MIRAPEGRETPNLPAGQVAVHDFTEPMVAPMYPLPLPMLQPQNSQSGRDSLDSRDIRKKMGELTPSQIMNVPTREQIFGLPEKLVGSQKEPWQLDNENSATNNPGFDTTSLISRTVLGETLGSGLREKPGILQYHDERLRIFQQNF